MEFVQEARPVRSRRISEQFRLRPIRSGLDIHRAWVIGGGLIAALVILCAQWLFAGPFVATTEIGFEAAAGSLPFGRVRSTIESPPFLAATVDRLDLSRKLRPDWHPLLGGAEPPRSAIAVLQAGLAVEATDLENVYTLRYIGDQRSLVAPIVNDLAARAVAPGRVAPGGGRIVSFADKPIIPLGSILIPLATALLAALFTSIAILFIREGQQPGLKGPREARAQLDLPVALMIPAVAGAAEWDRAEVSALPLVAPDSDYARAFRRWFARGGDAARSIAVCSSVADEGKSTFAISLARTAALAGRSVVLVDCDGRMRAASIALGATDRPGLVQVLEGDVSLDDALGPDPASSLRVLGHSGDPAQVDLWSKRRAETLALTIAELQRRFDLVVIDTPPLLALAEARQTAGLAQQVLLVARWRWAPVAAIRSAVRILATKGIRPTLALTFVRFAEKRPERGSGAALTERRLVAN